MPTTILVADDSATIRTLLRDVLEAEGYTVFTADDGEEALEFAREVAPDLVLLDVMMPGMDGFEVVRRLRRDGQTPVILLTARVAEADKVVGLELGADDYVTKPFSLHELMARIRAVLRRTRQAPAASGTLLAYGGLALDAERRRVTAEGRPVSLTPSEFALLQALLASPGRVLSRLQLLDTLGRADSGAERTVDVHVRNLRAKIEADPRAPRYLQTVFGVGYRIGDG